MYNPNFKELLRIMDDISSRMDEVIYVRYFDKYAATHGIHYKYLFTLFVDAYNSVKVICYSISNTALTQAGNLLRLLLETVSIINVLTNHIELIPIYRDHWKFRDSLLGMDNEQKKEKLKLQYPNINEKELLSYMDYGWFESITNNKCNELELIRLAGLDDFISWKKIYLDKFTHMSLNPSQFINKELDNELVDPFIALLCKLFDYLCCNFHNITKYTFIEENRSLFMVEFRTLYKNTQFKD